MTVRREAGPDWPVLPDDGHVDPVAVERVLAGEPPARTRAERVEAVRRWRVSGRQLKELESLTGWNVHRIRRHL